VFSSDDTAETYFAEGPLSGTFEFTETTITFTLSDNSKVWTMDYTLENGDLSLSNSQGDNPTKLVNGTLTKQNTKEEDKTAKFEGTWKTGIIAGADIRATYKFAGNTFEFTSNNTKEEYNIPKGPISGTFEFTDTTITFTLSDGSKTWSMSYILKNENLVLSLTQLQGSNPTTHFATLVKQGSSATSFESFRGTWKHQMAELNAVYTFTDNNWTLNVGQNEYSVPTGSLSGTFIFDDASMTFTATAGDTATFIGTTTWAQPYTIITQNNKEILDIEDTTDENMITWLFGSFEKQ
jgi:hypothetical protein